MNILSITDLTSNDVEAIFARAGRNEPAAPIAGTVAWSFEGQGFRTRASFLQALRELGLAVTELPDLLKTRERVEDLAGYLDPFFQLYVIRAADHERMAAFAQASSRPVVNAMSSRGHPCEVLTDAFFIDRSLKPLRDARIVLWGPTTNVFRSWHELARVMGLTVVQVCEERHHEADAAVSFVTAPPAHADIVITDFTPSSGQPPAEPLSEEHLRHMGHPALLPTPPFEVGRDLRVDPLRYAGFVGHAQKALLVPVQRAIVCHALGVA